jgi:hypothetical protein
MKLRVGFEMHYEFPQPTPMIMVLGTHFTRASDLVVPDYLTISPSVPITPTATSSATGAVASSLPLDTCVYLPMASSTTAGSRIPWLSRPPNI